MTETLVRDVMSGYVRLIGANDSIKAAAEAMEADDIGAVVVVDEGRVRALVTDRDIVVRGIARGLDPVETPDMTGVLEAADVSVVASSTLASGVLSGKYASVGASGRVADQLDTPRYRGAMDVAERLRTIAARMQQPLAAVAIAYALANANVASVLFGATRPEQVRENAQALGALERLEPSVLAELRAA